MSKLNQAFYLALLQFHAPKRKKRFDIGLDKKLSNKMKADKFFTLVNEKVDKENEIVQLRKKTEKLRNQIAYRRQKVRG